jgi:hypothetical protein
MAFPSIVAALGFAAANSVPTTTTIVRLGAAVPIETPVYVATVAEADTPAGFAVWLMTVAILTS